MLVPLCCSGFPNCQHSLIKKDMIPDPQPSCSEKLTKCLAALYLEVPKEVADDIFKIVNNAVDEQRGLSKLLLDKAADLEAVITAKQKTIEELREKLESCEMLSGSTMGSICCQYHRAEALEKELESLRAEVATLKRIDDVGIITNQNQHSEIDKLKAKLSRLKAEVDELKKALDHWTLMHIQESAKSAKLEARLSHLKEILKGRDEIFKWLLGDGDGFPIRQPGDGFYYWRRELRKKLEALEKGGGV